MEGVAKVKRRVPGKKPPAGGGMGFRVNRNTALNTSSNDPILALLKQEEEDND